MRAISKRVFLDGKTLSELYGDSTEQKPTDGIAQGSTFTELNAAENKMTVYMFDEASNSWVVIGGTNG